jgi:phage portal protein BeeE
MFRVRSPRMFLREAFGSKPLPFDEYVDWFKYGGLWYPHMLNQTLPGRPQEEIPITYLGFATRAFLANPVVYACMAVRSSVFSEARFKFRQQREGRPGDLFGTPALAILESPWPGATTGDLLERAIQDVDLAGNSFWTVSDGWLARLRPDWIEIIIGSPVRDAPLDHPSAQVLGYVYTPGGKAGGQEPLILERDQVAHFLDKPDPTGRFRGVSWLTSVVREIMGDSAASDHKLEYFEHGATPNMLIKFENPTAPEAMELYKEKFKAAYEGTGAKTIFLQHGVGAQPVGGNLGKDVDFKAVQGAGETRIAAAAQVPPVIVGLSEGLESATYSNYSQARRRFADGTMRPLWRKIAGSFSILVPPPPGSELWYDARDISFLQEDMKDEAEIQQTQIATVAAAISAGFDPSAAVDAVMSGDLQRLRDAHSGLVSVQLQKPGSTNGAVPELEPAA